jgi:hypothetical protein
MGVLSPMARLRFALWRLKARFLEEHSHRPMFAALRPSATEGD